MKSVSNYNSTISEKIYHDQLYFKSMNLLIPLEYALVSLPRKYAFIKIVLRNSEKSAPESYWLVCTNVFYIPLILL